jgi:hypothetical protein
MNMTKKEALSLFDGNGAALGRALGVSRATISKLPTELDRQTTMKMIGCAVLSGLFDKLPSRIRDLVVAQYKRKKAA